ncbi:centrosomal protein of 63 kDa [Rhinophrynus dorsalis]
MHGMEALLEGLQQQDRMGGLQGSCEAELQELMRQIDIMLDHKRSEWEAKTEMLTARLELMNQELSCGQAREEQLNQEVKALRQQLVEQEEGNRSKTAQYDAQLTCFQEELTRLKKSYEKVQRRHLRLEGRSRGEEEKSEVSRLTRRLEEFRQRSLDWEKQRLLYQQQVAGLEAQRRTLMEQADIYQQQSQSRKQMLEQTNVAGRSELQHLNAQLLRANDSICAKEEEAESLRLQLESTTERCKCVEQELEQAQQAIQVLKEEKAELQATLQAHTEFLQSSKARKDELQREVYRVSETLREKDNSIRSLEERLRETRLSEGHSEVEIIRSQLSISRRNEQKLQVEVTRLEESVVSVTAQCHQLNKELKEKVELLQVLEEEHKKCLADSKKLKVQLSQAELSYNSAVDGMKKEISQLTLELHQRDISLASSVNAAVDWERKIRAERERAEREEAEHMVSLTTLETLQQENRQLTELLEKQEPDVLQALDNLEQENKKLQNELSQTQEKLELILQCRESEIQNEVERRSQELLSRHEQELKAEQERLKEISERYEEELRTLRLQQDATANLRCFSRTCSLESVIGDVWKDKAQGSPGSAGNEDSCEESRVEPSSVLPLPPASPANTVASRFLQEEELRSQDLLQLLNLHIEELKQDSQRTVQHFTQAR